MRAPDLNRANLFLNHQRAKHSDSCWSCDQPWPCLAVAALIDADHEWAQWFEKWTAALDVSANALAEVERLQSELAPAQEPKPLPLGHPFKPEPLIEDCCRHFDVAEQLPCGQRESAHQPGKDQA